jgi:hypothetical protein
MASKIQQKNSTINASFKDKIMDPDLSPLLINDFDLKEYNALNVYVLTVGHDIVTDDSYIYVERLRNLGFTRLKHEHFDHLFHGIFGLLNGPLEFDDSHVLMKSVTNHINHILDSSE